MDLSNDTQEKKILSHIIQQMLLLLQLDRLERAFQDNKHTTQDKRCQRNHKQ